MKVESKENCVDAWRLMLQICWDRDMLTIKFSEGVFCLYYDVMAVQI